MNNFHAIQAQVAERADKRAYDHRVDNLYYKPHFGPEETDTYLDQEDHRTVTIRNHVNTSLNN